MLTYTPATCSYQAALTGELHAAVIVQVWGRKVKALLLVGPEVQQGG
jgi:hypothetical protein